MLALKRILPATALVYLGLYGGWHFGHLIFDVRGWICAIPQDVVTMALTRSTAASAVPGLALVGGATATAATPQSPATPVQTSTSVTTQTAPVQPSEDVTAASCAVLCQLLYDNADNVKDGKYADGMKALIANATQSDSGWHASVIDRLKNLTIANDDECTLNAACFSSNDELFIVCKGTVDWRDLWQDVGIFFCNRPWTRAAHTQEQALKWVGKHEKVLEDHNKANPQNPKSKKRIILTGHSLGATVAYIVSAMFLLGRNDTQFSLHDVHMFNAGRGPFFWNDPIEYDFEAYITNIQVQFQSQSSSSSSSSSSSLSSSWLQPTGRLCHHFINGDPISSWIIPSALKNQTVFNHYDQPQDLKSQKTKTHSLINFHYDQPQQLLPARTAQVVPV
jgi:hypothetical protein